MHHKRFPHGTVLRECRADGCHRLTMRISGWCSPCEGHVFRLGVPGAKMPTPKDMAPFDTLAQSFIHRFADHPATVAALGWCRSLLHSEYEAHAGAERELLRYLLARGVTAEQVMVAAGGTFLRERMNPLAYRGPVHANGVAARRVCRLCPRRKPFPGEPCRRGNHVKDWPPTARRRLGELLREQLALYWFVAADKIAADLKAGETIKAALAVPFE
ncbi:MAG: hypothetical protein ACYCOY_06470 [Metallibacterium sp.]